MGQERVSSPVRYERFLGLNTRISPISIDRREAAWLQNVNITDESLYQRLGSTSVSSNVFQDKTDTSTKNITGLYEGTLGTTTYQVGVGGDAFKQLSGGSWVDKTGAITITDDDDNHWNFATFIDNSADNVIVGCNGVDQPFKWTGTGDATTWSAVPGTGAVNYPVVHKNKLWVSEGNILYFSNLRDMETWTGTDLAVFDHKGENITGLYKYNDLMTVFQESQISFVSGSSYRDLYIQTVLTGDGCICGESIQEIPSKAYGNILIFLSPDGRFKGFNGSKNLIDLGFDVDPTFKLMNQGRLNKCVSGVIEELGQYWIAMSLGSETENHYVFVYDYKNDYFTNEVGRKLSSILYHTGIDINAMATFSSSGTKYLVTGDYSGGIYKQNFGYSDKGSSPIICAYQSKREDFGAPSHVKSISDLNVVTLQNTDTTMSITVDSGSRQATSDLTIEALGDVYDEGEYDTAEYGDEDIVYTRCKLTPFPATEERPVLGRYLQIKISHSDLNEALRLEEITLAVQDRGMQQEFTE